MTGSIDMECFVTIRICGQCSRLEAALHPGLHTGQAGCGPLPSPPQDHRALGPRGCCVLLPSPSRVWTSHPCAGPGRRRFGHSPRETHGGGPIPSEAQDTSRRCGGSWRLGEPQCPPSGSAPTEQRLCIPLEAGWLQGR